MLRSSSSSCSSSEGEVDQLPRKRNSKGVKSKGQLQVPVHRAPPLAPSLTPSSTPSLSPCPSPVQTLSSRSSLAGSSSSVQGTTLAPPAQPHSGQAFPPSPRPRRSRPARDDRVSGDPGLGPDQRRLQLYVLLARCASLPFCAKQPPELTHQRLKINKQQLFAFKIKVWNFLEEKPSNNADENFCSIVQEYYEVFLCSRKVEQAFEAGGWSSHELRQAFFRCLERGLQNYDSISMREVMQKTSMSKFEVLLQGVTEESSPHQPSLGKDQLLEMFQKVLGIPKLEHQRIYNACQLDNADEQVAQIRRELGRRRERAAFAAKMKTFLDKNMEKTYVEEVKTSIQQLIDNLESLPLGKGGPRNRLVQHPVVSGDIASGGRTLAKYNINISFSVEVVVMEATGLVSVPSGKQVYCTMEMEGGDKLQTEAVDADKPKWHTQGDFTTAAPLPVLKVRLLTIVNKMLSLEDKELGKVTLRPSPMTMKPPELHDLITPRHSSDENLQLLLHLRMERPPNLKHSGYLLARGKNVWRSWKKRFYALIQGSACTYILCNFQENKVEPQSIIQLDGYTVDYAQLPSDVYGGQVHFSLVREGETFHFGCDDAQDAGLWVQALYRATGQTHRPTLHGQGSSRHRNTSNAGACSDLADPDKASKLIDKVLAADPCDLDHESLFELLQRLTFRHRMKDPYCSLGWFSPGQLFMLDEYCSRYGVSGCHRHLCYLDQLINRAEDGIAIDPTLLHYSYAFCTSHITQNKPDGFSSITVAENAHYKEIKDRIKLMLEHQISHFRFYFPFGLPEGALKATVGLLEKVLMEDMSTPVPAEQIHSVLSTCLRRAAMINYMGLSAENGVWDSNVKGLEELQALAEECVDLLLQSEEQHGMLLCRSPELFKEYSESFWSLFAVDMDAMLNHQPDYSWEYFSLFHLLNRHLSIDQYLCNGPFHIHLQNSFEPILDSYLETMEASIAQSVHRSLQQETWHPIHSNKSATSLELLGKLQMLQSFITDLQWPNENYAASIDSRLKNNANDVMACCINRMGTAFEAKLKKMSKGLQMRVDETLCSMYNLLGDAKQQLGVFCCSDKQKLQECKAWIEIEKTFKHMTSLLITRLVDVLHDVLSKLARYDLGTLFSSILSLTSTSMDLADSYVTFVRQNQEIISEKGLSDELQQRIFTVWCLDTFNVLDEWLKDRPSLHIHQFNSLDLMVRMCQKDFERRGCLPSVPAVQRVQERLKVESALVEVAASSRS